MSPKKTHRVRSKDQGGTGLRGWLQPGLRAPIGAWAIAFTLAIGLAICEADLLVPLFWQRRLPVQLGLVLAAAILQMPLLVRGVRGFMQELPSVGSPVRLLARWVIGLGLGATLLALIWAAAVEFQATSRAPTPVAIAVGTPTVLHPGIEWTFLALLVLMLVLPGTRPAVEALTPQQRIRLPLYFLTAGFALVYLLNTVLPMLDVSAGRFATPNIVPTYDPVGMDFRRGMYLPAVRLLAGGNAYPLDAAKSPNLYPPFVTLLGTVFTWLSEESAVRVHALLLCAVNVTCLILAVVVLGRTRSRREDEEAAAPALMDLTLIVLVGVSLFSGYPFLFSFERGNIDALAMVLATAAYLVLARNPERMWWQIVLLSLAVHIKAYPALLLLPLFIVHRRRMILPTLLVNVALLLCLGPANAAGFLLSLLRFYEPISWVGNHSAYSFAGILAPSAGGTQHPEWIAYAAFTAAVLIPWGSGLRAAMRYTSTSRLAAAGLVLTAPVMAILPGISYDYQLVILYAPILLLLAMIVESMRERQEPADYVQLMLVVLAAGMIGRSYLIMPGVSQLIQNKYAWVMLLELVALVQILREVGQTGARPGARSGRRASVSD